MESNFVFYARKTVCISYIGIINFVISIIFAQLIHKYVSKPYDSSRNYCRNIFQMLCIIVSIVLCGYISRRIIKVIPKPLKSETFDPKKIKEIRGTIVTAFSYFMFLASDLNTYKHMISFI